MKSMNIARRSVLCRIGIISLVAAMALCVGGQTFAHIDGVGEESGKYGVHLPHESLVGTINDPAARMWIDGTAHDSRHSRTLDGAGREVKKGGQTGRSAPKSVAHARPGRVVATIRCPEPSASG